MKRTQKSNQKGFTLIEIAIVIAIITLLALGVAQSAVYFRTAANTNLCVVNQKQIQDAVRSVANLNNLAIGAALADDAAPLCNDPAAYFPGALPTCPENATYGTIGKVPDVGVEYVNKDNSTDGVAHLAAAAASPGFASW